MALLPAWRSDRHSGLAAVAHVRRAARAVVRSSWGFLGSPDASAICRLRRRVRFRRPIQYLLSHNRRARQLSDRLRGIVATGLEAAEDRPRRYRAGSDHAFSWRPFCRPSIPAARRPVLPPDPAAGDRGTRRNPNASDTGDGSAIREFIEDKAALRALGGRAQA